MKQLSIVFLILFFSLSVTAQKVYRWYEDGKIVFQLKEDVRMPKAVNAMVDLPQFPALKSIAGEYGIQSIKQLHPNIKDEKLRRTYQVEFSEINKVDQLLRKLKEDIQFLYVEKKELHESFLTPNDQYYSSSFNNGQWALFQIDADLAWDISTGSSDIVVAVTDNAINVDHPDLVNKMVAGWDAAENDNDPRPCGNNDGFHGSHVAGIVGAESNNNIGIASIGFDVSIMPVKIGDCNSGALTAGYEGIIWAADNGADVINMSWGGGGQSQYGQNVCNYAWDQGSILVAAAGNDDVNSVFYPAGYNNVISVASSTSGDAKSSFSNYGTWIDITAPGSSILSCNEGTAYQITQGTSMASPMVAGLLGLMKSHAPSTSQQEIVDCLLNSSDDIDGANPNYVGQLGAGRINAHQALLCMNQYTYTLDVGITEIINPVDAICSSTVDPQVVLRNFGSDAVTQVEFNYQVDAGPIQTFSWTGNLAQGETAIVTLPTITPGAGAHTITVSTSSPNAGSDENVSNDDESSNFNMVANGQVVDLTLVTDCYGSEISWSIEEDGTGLVWATSDTYGDVAGGETINESTCLASGCYVFKINDSYGDGMNGSQWNNCSVDGNYFMEDESGANLFNMTAPNGDFGSQTTHDFCIVSNLALDAGVASVLAPSGGICGSDFTPSVDLVNFGTTTLTSVDILYNIGGVDEVFNWSGNLVQGASEVVVLPLMTTTDGVYTFTAVTENPNGGTDENANNDLKTKSFTVFTSAIPLPFEEDFESNTFSSNNWILDNPDNGITWEIATVGGSTPGDKAAKMDFYNYGNGSERDGLQTPPLDFTNYVDVTMTFDHAFRRYDANSADSLIIYVSTDCGATFDRLVGYAEDGTGSFATATTNTASFTPGNGDWCTGTVGSDCFTIDLSAYDDAPSVIVRFEGFNNGVAGNNLFIDNINIDGILTNSPPIAEILLNDTLGCEGYSVNFTDASIGQPTSWLWDFGDGNTSTQQNPTHIYAIAGTYTVSLTASNSFGSDSETIVDMITINAPVSFSQSLSICEGQSVTVGSSTYTAQGNYVDVLVSSVGCDSTVNTQLTVNPLPNVSLTMASNLVCDDAGVQALNGTPAGGNYTGYGVIGANFYPDQVALGTYNINYSYTDGNGCSASSSLAVTVEECVNIEENIANDITIYPNPTNGTVYIDLGNAASEATLTVKGLDGKVIKKEIFNQTNLEVTLDTAPGIYFFEIAINNSLNIFKVVKN